MRMLDKSGVRAAPLWPNVSAYDVLRWGFGLLLIAAAILKAVEFWNDPASAVRKSLPAEFSPASPSMAVGLFASFVLVEVIVGTCLVANLWQMAIHYCAATLFTGFAIVALLKAMAGHSTCGCFGSLSISPWFTFAVDVFGVASLLILRPPTLRRDHSGTDSQRGNCELSPSTTCVVTRRCMILTACCLTAILVGFLISGRPITTLIEGNSIAPESVVGKPFRQIVESTETSELLEGRWLILIYRPECPACQRALEGFADRLQFPADHVLGTRAAAIEISPNLVSEGLPPFMPSQVRHVRVDRLGQRLPTPLLVRLHDGAVTAVETGEKKL